MIDEAATVEEFDSMTIGDSEIAESAEIARVQARRRLLALCHYMNSARRAGIVPFIIIVLAIGSLVGLVYGTHQALMHNARVQAVQRAMKMDGEVYTISDIGFSLVGDTRLYLKDEQGREAGWINIYMNNPFTSEVHPLFLTMMGKGYEPMPVGMKVKTHFRPTAWSDKNVSTTRENYTGSFIEFEIISRP